MNNYKEPKSFGEVLELQAILDRNIVNVRKRNGNDIRMSLIAEAVEFNEETGLSHKTWKDKGFNKDNMIEEGIDIMFFVAQFINIPSVADNADYFERVFNEAWSLEVNPYDMDVSELTLKLINVASGDDYYVNSMIYVENVIKCLVAMYNQVGISKSDVFRVYFEKWQKNVDRIGTEWN